VDAALRGEPAEDPILPALADTVRIYRIAPRYFHDLLDGTEMDQSITRYRYVSGPVPVLIAWRRAWFGGAAIFGCARPNGQKNRRSCGIAVPTHQHLRDIQEMPGWAGSICQLKICAGSASQKTTCSRALDTPGARVAAV